MGLFSGIKKVVKGVAKGVKRVVKGIGKVFGKIFGKLPGIAKIALTAVAAYFTFGVALSYFPAAGAQAFAAGLPGFTGASGAGTGIFSQVATKMGMGSGLKAGAAATAASQGGATLAAGGAAGAAEGAALGATVGEGAAGMTAAEAATAGATAGTPGAAANALPTVAETWTAGVGNVTGNNLAAYTGGQTAGAAAKMTAGEKLLLAGTGMQAAGAFLSGSDAPEEEPPKGFYGQNLQGGAVDFRAEPIIDPNNPYATGNIADADIMPPKMPESMISNPPGEEPGPQMVKGGMQDVYYAS